MATGYTHPIKDGEDISPRDFILRCSRAMGAAVTERDLPLGNKGPELRRVSDYYYESVGAAEQEARLWGYMTPELAERRQNKEISDAEWYRLKYIADRDAARTRYEAMLTQIRRWNPPTEDHEYLKKFMIEQLESSIEFDCDSTYEPRVPERMSSEDYIKHKREQAEDALNNAEQSLAEEQERVRGQNEWVNALYDALSDFSD